MTHGKPARSHLEVIEVAEHFLGIYSLGDKLHSCLVSHSVAQSRGWLALPVGGLKLNVDAAVKLGLDFVGVGGVIKDHLGMEVGSFPPMSQSVCQ